MSKEKGFTSVPWNCDVLFSFEVDSDDAFSCEDVLSSFVAGSGVAFLVKRQNLEMNYYASLK